MWIGSGLRSNRDAATSECGALRAELSTEICRLTSRVARNAEILVGRTVRGTAIVVAFAVLGACTQVPVEKFSAYKTAFAEAQSAQVEVLAAFTADGEALLNVIDAQRLGRQQKLSSGGDASDVSSLPSAIRDDAADGDGKTLADHVHRRVVAMETIGQFNELLTAFANGESEEQLAERLKGLHQSTENLLQATGRTIPGLGTLFGAFITLAKVAEKERSKARFKEAIIAGRPMIDEVIGFLIDDVQTYDSAQLARSRDGLDRLGVNRLPSITSAIAKVAHSRKDPVAADLMARVDKVVKRANDVRKNIRLSYQPDKRPPQSPAFTAPRDPEAAAVLDELGVSQIEQFGSDIEAIEAERAKIVEGSRAASTALRAYMELLSAVSNALGEVERNLDQPRDPVAMARELTQLAITVRSQIGKIRAR